MATINGTGGNDYLTGTSSNDLMRGFSGNDQLYGFGGGDRLEGGDGIDLLYGNDGADQLFGEGGRDDLFGGQANDDLKGGSDNDRLYGDLGNDTLDGNSGFDFLDGGPGNDTFYYTPGVDQIGNIEAGDSLITTYSYYSSFAASAISAATQNVETSIEDQINIDWSRFGAPHVSSFEEFITWKETQRLEFIQESIETGLQEEARLTALLEDRKNGLPVTAEGSVDPLTGVDTETLESLLSETQTRTEYLMSSLEEPEKSIWEPNYFLPTDNYIGDSEIIAVPPGSSELADSIFSASHPERSFTIVEVEGLAYPEDLLASSEYSAEPFLA